MAAGITARIWETKMKKNRSLLDKAQEMATQKPPSTSMELITIKVDSGDIPTEYVKGKPQIHEIGALFTGLIDKMPKGPRTDVKGSSPTRQRRIIRQASMKLEMEDPIKL